MPRSIKKGPYLDEKLLKKVSRLKQGDKSPIKTWSRDAQVSPRMIGYVFAVHNGKNFINVEIKEEHVGHHLGEFAPTRKFTRHGGKMQRELESKTKGGPVAPAAKT